MSNERDELRKAEKTKKTSLLGALFGAATVVAKLSSDIKRDNEINNLKVEKSELDKKFFKSQEDKRQIREIEERLGKLEKNK